MKTYQNIFQSYEIIIEIKNKNVEKIVKKFESEVLKKKKKVKKVKKEKISKNI